MFRQVVPGIVHMGRARAHPTRIDINPLVLGAFVTLSPHGVIVITKITTQSFTIAEKVQFDPCLPP